jgi:hypothetical protein
MRKVNVIVDLQEDGGVFRYSGYVVVGELALIVGDPDSENDCTHATLQRIKPSIAHSGMYEFAGDQSLEIDTVDDAFRDRLATADEIGALALFDEYLARLETPESEVAA